MMHSMYETVVHLGLARLLGGGRMPGYGQYAAEMSAEHYLEHVLAGRKKGSGDHFFCCAAAEPPSEY